MIILGTIISRAGSKGLPDKCVRALRGRAVITYTFDHAKASRLLTGAVLTTDSEPAKDLAREAGIEVIDRPAELATDKATVDAAARHAVETWESRHHDRVRAVVLLYGNVPVRAKGVIDRAIEHLIQSGADSVRTVAPVTKQHPDWVHRLEGDRMIQFRPNSIYRRQDLEPLYYHDGAVAVVTRAALFGALETPDDHQAFLGADRRAIIQEPEDSVDIDAPIDLHLAEALLRAKGARTRADHDVAAPAIRPVKIGGREVGPGRRTFLVAEAGVNHNGSVKEALKLVDAAASRGADAVKFQVFRAIELATESAATARYQQETCGESSQRELLSHLELSTEDLRRIRDRCVERSILFMATPFSPADVDRLVGLGTCAIKIASTDLTSRRLLRRAADARLPIIVSTGASTAEEIRRTVDELRSWGLEGRLILLHCVSSYPTPLKAANLRAISTLEAVAGVPCGLSDHTTSTRTGGWAVSVGACLLEKHFTLDRSAKGPDHSLSLDPDELEEYVSLVREAEQALGSGRLGMTELEEQVRRTARKSIVSAVDIPRATFVTEAMLTTKRPGTGISPLELANVVGRKTAVDIPGDTILSWEMFL